MITLSDGFFRTETETIRFYQTMVMNGREWSTFKGINHCFFQTNENGAEKLSVVGRRNHRLFNKCVTFLSWFGQTLNDVHCEVQV